MMKFRRSIIGAGVCTAVILTAVLARPFLREPLSGRYRSSQAIYARNGELLRLTLSNDQKFRQWVSLKSISPAIINSFLVSEDKYFYSHWGLNPVSLGRAVWSTYFTGGRRSGASTITMQLARMLGPIDSKKLSGKFQQISSAFWLEYLYTKEEILEAYLNLVPMGGNIEGVGAASLIFFGKKPSELKWAHALTLAVIPQNPNKRTLLKGFPAGLQSARMRLFEKISHLVPDTEKGSVPPEFTAGNLTQLPFLSPHFTNKVIDRSSGKNEVNTTLSLPLQKTFEKKISDYLSGKKMNGIKNASVLLVNWQTSEIISWVGSADFFDPEIKGQVDGVTSLRSPGSALKPFIYGLALQEGLIHPGTILKDTPRYFGSYDPENFDGEFKGPLSAEEALNESRNLPAVELMTKLARPDFYQFLMNTKVGNPRSREFYGHSLALGGYEVTLLDLVNLYSALPRQGYLRDAIFSQDELRKLSESRSILDAESSFLVLDMLSHAEFQSRRFHRLLRRGAIPVSWKTGTSSGFRDAWTVGVFGPYALGVWIGNFSGESNRQFIGREVAAPLFFDLVDAVKIHAKLDASSTLAWQAPPKVKKVNICATSGKLPGPHCRHQSHVFFIPGTSPIATCDVHRQIWISKADGKLSCKPDPTKDIARVHEFWPSDILETFSAAGLPRKPVPETGASCGKYAHQESFGRGIAPEILSPREGSIYSLRSQVENSKMIPFEGNYDSSADELFWFVNNEFIGKSTEGKALLWKARAGKFVVKAIDNLGRSVNREMKVQYVE
ncbi:MAG: penicillin-binding protein 1C [Bdellovibrionota bacterium]